MNKELEALNSLDKLEECAYAMKDLPKSNWIDLAENEAELDLKIMNWTEKIKFELFKGQQGLERLEAIDNSNPSEALEELFKTTYFGSAEEYKKIDNCYNTIKQALIKSQEQEKENQEFKRKYENHDFLYQNEVSKNGALAGKIFEKDLKIKKLEKVIEIIKKKNVDIEYIKTCFYDEKGGMKEYNSWVGHDEDRTLTQEEYNLLKEVFDD